MLRIGLTGGIGSGKSAAADCFRDLGVAVIDSDQLARELVEPGQPALASIADHFGDIVLCGDGRLDRDRLRKAVHQNPAERQWLEQLLHPLIRTRRNELIKTLDSPYVVLEIPLLIETDLRSDLDRVLLIDLPESLQLQRTMQRSAIDEAEVRAIMKNQASREARLAAADDVIDNSGSKQALCQQIARLHERYMALIDEPA